MTDPEKVISEQQQQTTQNSTSEQDISNYTEIFCKTISQLNAVSLGHAQGLLDIAVRAAEKFHSLNSSATVDKDELSGFINQIQIAAADVSQINNQQTPENLSAQSRATNPETFPEMVEQALGLALQNSVANQQALNEMGIAILGKAANLLLSAGAKKD